MLLNGEWVLQGENQHGEALNLPAVVPGCVHTDLMKNGIIDDIFYRDNSCKYLWIENKNFTYTKKFFIQELQSNAYLEFDGLDTYCSIFLNSIEVGRADNMFIRHCFNVDGVLRQGENTLEVRFRSPIKEVEACPKRGAAFTNERLYTRRIQCTYGWDWVERFVTMGICRDVRLTFRKPNEIDNFYLYTKSVTGKTAQLNLDVYFRDFERNEDEVEIEILAPNGKQIFFTKRTVIESRRSMTIDIPDAELWFPNGYGEQPLYMLMLKTKHSSVRHSFGIREAVVIQTEDKEGSREQKISREIQSYPHIDSYDKNDKTSRFTLYINGVEIFCKGANWVPCDPFVCNESDEKIARLLSLAQSCGVNMLRVWGGGVFEKDIFYSECDRLGILTTQDFLMACGDYPEAEEWFIAQLQKEARDAALRLRNYTSLVWWSGDNENAVMGSDDTTDYSGYISATHAISPVLRELDANRYFFPSSPFGGKYFCSATKGTTHATYFLGSIFDYIENSDFSDYRDFFDTFLSRFNVEQPIMGMSFESSMKKYMTDEDIHSDNTDVIEYHTKNNPALKLSLYDYSAMMAEKLFGKFQNADDRNYKLQMLQCERIRSTMELYRRNKWYSSGLLYWMFNDCWPAAVSWSILDYYANPKPSFYAFKRCAKPFIVALNVKDGKLCLYACNDSLNVLGGTAKLYAYDYVNDVNTVEKEIEFEIKENTSELIFSCDYSEFSGCMSESSIIICDAQTSGISDRTFFTENKFDSMNIKFDDFEIIEDTDKDITVKANGFVPFVILDSECLLSDNCFTLKANEIKTVFKML